MNERINKKVIIDAGHGGNDPGTSKNGIVEKDYNLKISKYISKRLNDLNIPNTLVRSTDETLSPSDRVKRIKNIYGTGSNVLLISNHLNSGGGDGAEIIYALRNSDAFSKIIAKNMEEAGQNVRKYYQKRLASSPSRDYYFILRDTANNESILMEYGFVDSTKDDINLIKNNYETLAEAMVKSIAEYLGVTYKKPADNIGNYYIVQKGDTLWIIANKYKVTVNKLKEINNLSSNLITVGQKLIIPGNMKEYIVQKGDTLYAISRKFNTTVTDIISLNNLKSTTIQIGQKLLIP